MKEFIIYCNEHGIFFKCEKERRLNGNTIIFLQKYLPTGIPFSKRIVLTTDYLINTNAIDSISTEARNFLKDYNKRVEELYGGSGE